MSNREPRELIEELERMSEADRLLFFEQIGVMCNTFSYSRSFITGLMFPPRTNNSHGPDLEHCRRFVRDHGFLTRTHAFATMQASTFRRAILKPLLEEGVIELSEIRWRRNGQGQGHKVYRDKTERYLNLENRTEARTLSMSIVNEPGRTAQKFVSSVLTRKDVMQVGFPKTPGLVLNLHKLGYKDANHESVKDWCKVVEEEIRRQSVKNVGLKVYEVHNGKIWVKTNTGVMKND